MGGDGCIRRTEVVGVESWMIKGDDSGGAEEKIGSWRKGGDSRGVEEEIGR